MLTKEQLKEILTDQRASMLRKPLGIEREVLPLIKKKLPLPHIVVLTGLRRSGKSTILRQIIKKYYSDEKFYYINFEDERLLNFQAENFNEIYEVLFELFGKKKTFFIDEIQNVENFELFVRRFYDEGFKFYITGSSAKLLSRELGTKLTGRHVDITVTPFSFKEFLKFKNIETPNVYETEKKVEIKKLFNEYYIGGGMPEFIRFEDKEILTRIYEDIINKDVIVRYDIKNTLQLRELYQYIVTNLANKFSYNNLAKLLDIKSSHTIKKFLGYLEETHFLKILTPLEYSPKKLILSEKKPYIVDNGFIGVISTKFTKDSGWILENLVFNSLKGFNVNYYVGQLECDFIVSKDRKILGAIQVCFDLNNKNREREINGLLEAMDKFNLKEGIILTMDQEEEIIKNNKKIFVKPLWKTLLKKII